MLAVHELLRPWGLCNVQDTVFVFHVRAVPATAICAQRDAVTAVATALTNVGRAKNHSATDVRSLKSAVSAVKAFVRNILLTARHARLFAFGRQCERCHKGSSSHEKRLSKRARTSYSTSQKVRGANLPALCFVPPEPETATCRRRK